MKNFRILCLLLLLLIGPKAYSQDPEYLLNITAGKKVLNMENLNLAPTTPAYEILVIFPELLAREGDKTLANYDVQIDDVSTGNSKENVLMQLKLCDIKSIEVSATPSTSQQKNGQGGVINIKLKELKEGLSGDASVFVNSYFQAQPGVMLGFKKNAWTIRSSFLMEYYQPNNETSARETIFPLKYTYTTDSLYLHHGYEMLNFYAKYQPDKKDKLEFWAMERFGKNKDNRKTAIETNSKVMDETSEEIENDFKYLLGANYEHNFQFSTLKAECYLEGNPYTYSKYKYDANSPKNLRIWQYENQQNNTKFSGQIKYTWHFVPVKPHNKVDFTVGTNLSNDPITYGYQYSFLPSNDLDQEIPQSEILNSDNRIFYLSPYIESNNEFGRWFLKAGLRYQHYLTDINIEKQEDFNRPENYFTAFINLGCQVAPHHHLSLIVDRSVKRMDPYMMYPYQTFSPMNNYFIMGNRNLQPISIHNLALNYITDFTVNDKYFTFDAELKYINSNNLIKEEKKEDAIHYYNDGNSNILTANFLFLFTYKVFSLHLTGNYFANSNKSIKSNYKYNYFNLSLTPVMNFGNGWNASVRFTYNSHIYADDSQLSDYLYTVTRFAKTWNNITAYMELCDNFHKQAMDVIYSEALYEAYYYNLHRPGLELGFNIKF